jgi:hypothetical protein
LRNATGTITDDDLPPVVWISNTSLFEGDSGTTNAAFPLTLSKPAIYNVTVNYHTQDGTATSTNDYVAQTSSVTFLAGTTNATILVPVNGNTVNEPDETFFIILTSASNATLGTNTAVCTILNDDDVPGRLDHFAIDPVASPQYTNRSFKLTVRAVDYLGNRVGFGGSVPLAIEGDQYLATRLWDDFEDGDLVGWTNYSSPQLLASNVVETAAGGFRSLKLIGKAPTPASYYGLRRQITNSRPTDISFYVKAAQANANCGRLNAMGGANYTAVDFYMTSKG